MIVGIVTYNPKTELLSRLILNLIKQNAAIYIYDNNSDNIEEINDLVGGNGNVILFRSDKNNGLPVAYNHLCDYALKNEYKWILLFDQDSTPPDNIIFEYSRFLTDKHAWICPQFMDRKFEIGSRKLNKNGVLEEIEWSINSGACINLAVWKAIGGYDENLFCDLVDYDYCINLKEHGYKIFRLNSVVIEHDIGEAAEIKVLNRKIKLRTHSAVRIEDLAYSNIYLRKKYKKVKHKYSLLNHLLLRYLKRALSIIIIPGNRRENISALFRGLKRGLKSKVIYENT